MRRLDSAPPAWTPSPAATSRSLAPDGTTVTATADIAAGYVDALIGYIEGLAELSRRGLARDDIRPGLRTISYRKRTVVAFAVMGDAVAIIGIFHGGRDYTATLRETDE